MRTALVTGGNRGIGLAVVAGLASQGDIAVLLGCRSIDEGRRIAGNFTGVTAVELDLTDREQLTRQVAAISSQHGAVDVLVNNSGVLEYGNLLEVDEAKLDEALRVNFAGPLDLIRLLVPGMIERAYGRVVNVSSGWGSFAEGLTGPGAYSIGKAALNAVTLSLARSLPSNVKVNSVCPGWVRTRMGGSDAHLSPEQGADTVVWLATLPDEGPSGGFYRSRHAIEW